MNNQNSHLKDKNDPLQKAHWCYKNQKTKAIYEGIIC